VVAAPKGELCLTSHNIGDVSPPVFPSLISPAQIPEPRRIAKGKTCFRPRLRGGRKRGHSSWRGRKGRNMRYQTTTNHARRTSTALGFRRGDRRFCGRSLARVRRITEGYGADIVIDASGGRNLGRALGTLAWGKSDTLGYSAAAGNPSTSQF